MFYTYLWRDRTGVPFYVGKGRGKRAFEIACRSKEFKTVKAKGGCTVEIIDEFVFESQAHALEVELIARYRRREHGGPLVNKTDGGEGASGSVRSVETRAKMSAAKKGRTYSAEHRAKMSAAKKGRAFSPEHRAKINAANKGKTLSPEHRAKMSAAQSGKPLSPEHRAKLSAANKRSAYNVARRAVVLQR